MLCYFITNTFEAKEGCRKCKFCIKDTRKFWCWDINEIKTLCPPVSPVAWCHLHWQPLRWWKSPHYHSHGQARPLQAPSVSTRCSNSWLRWTPLRHNLLDCYRPGTRARQISRIIIWTKSFSLEKLMIILTCFLWYKFRSHLWIMNLKYKYLKHKILKIGNNFWVFK